MKDHTRSPVASAPPPYNEGSMFGHIFGSKPITKNGVLLNFVLLGMFFGINHATITSVIAIGGPALNKQQQDAGGAVLSGYFNGSLYASYVLVALTFSSPLVEYLRPWKAMVSAMFIYIFYIAGYIIALYAPINEDAKKIVAILSCAIAGLSSGWLWTAQGAFFARSAQVYSELSGTPITTTTRQLGAAFTLFYVGFEFVGKLATSPISKATDFGTLCVIYSIVAALSGLGTLLFVRDLPEESKIREKMTVGRFARKTLLTVDLIRRSRRMLLIIPLEVAFGFASAFLTNYVAAFVGKVVGDDIGYISAAVPATAAFLSIPVGIFSPKTGNGPLLVLGCLCWTIMPFVRLVVSDDQLSDLGYGLVFFYIIQGIGRVMFESANKAMIAEFFPNDMEAAFSNVIVWSGTSALIGYFVFPNISITATAIICMASGALSIVTITILFFSKKGMKEEEAEAESIEADEERLRLINECAE